MVDVVGRVRRRLPQDHDPRAQHVHASAAAGHLRRRAATRWSAAALVVALEEWAVDYEERNAFRSPCGDVRRRPGRRIRGGVPYRPNRSSTVCKLYMDMRTVPGGDQDAVIEEVRQVARQVDPQAEVECYMAKQGLIGTGVEPLADAISAAYDSIVGGPTPIGIAATSIPGGTRTCSTPSASRRSRSGRAAAPRRCRAPVTSTSTISSPRPKIYALIAWTSAA